MGSNDTAGGDAAFAADTDDLRATARTLTEVAHAAGATRTRPLQGVGVDARAVEDAAARFRSTWETSLSRWSMSLSSLATSVSAASGAIEGADASSASMWNGVRGVRPW